jgi:hypothetical protein
MSFNNTIQSVRDWALTFPDVTKVLGNAQSGFSNLAALRCANATLQELLGRPYNWKFNSVNAPVFNTVPYQQDYMSNISDMGWIENCTRVDINNTTTPKPIYPMESDRDLQQTSWLNIPTNICWIQNSRAILGTWAALTSFPSQIPASTPSPIQQIKDPNGNLQIVTTNGTTGASSPSWPAASAAAGTTTSDGSVVWTVVDPNAIAFRVSALPPQSGITWSVQPIYQKKSPFLTALSSTWAPFDDSYEYVYSQGFLAHAKRFAGSPDALAEYELFEANIQKALVSGDREKQEFGMYPGKSLMHRGRSIYPGSSAYPFGPSY